MTILTGLIKDPFENPVNGILTITLVEPKVDIEAEEIILPLSQDFYITDGIVNLEIPESESYENNYLFEFKPEGIYNNVEPFPFYGVIPDISNIDLIDLVPIRKFNRDLNEAAVKVARLISRNEELAIDLYNINPLGDYNDIASYNRGSIVTYGGKDYIAIKASSGGKNPLDTEYWYKLTTDVVEVPDGSINKLKLDSEVNNLLGLADTALQPEALINYEDTTQLNIRDSANRDRANHTGTQDISTIFGLQTALNNKQPIGDYATNTELNAGLSTKQDNLGFTPENISNKNVNNGYCGLDSGGKVPLNNLPSTLLNYQGVWDASTNTPTLINPDLTKTGFVYIVNVAGTRFGINFNVGDWLIYNSNGIPEKSDNSDDIVSVNGQTGIVVINKTDIGLGNVVNLDTSTTFNITDSIDKRFVTDAQQTIINNTSGINTGDISLNTNSLSYISLTGQVLNLNPIPQSNVTGLLTSLSNKQDNLISGTNIKTINNNSILGSGNLVINTDIEPDPLIALMQATGSNIKAHTAIIDRIDVVGTITSGRMYFTLFLLRKATLITSVSMINNFGGNYTPTNTNGVAIYSISGTDLIKQREGINPNFFQSANNTRISVNLTTPLNLPAGLYVFAYIYSASAAVSVPRPYQLVSSINVEQSTVFLDNYQIPMLSFRDGLTNFPATIAISSLTRIQRAGYARFY